ncbi:MAG: 2,3-bisphosphoglycerate-independent phosphoglycerate mutase [Archaeoglobus sp.]|uniref:2,3-bisphosphoglycerate-independent phosphoglycerate mutase n=1 Tax=Archaeoglobus sp. TaxID=1872626 RepID=UPI001D3D91B9|nr:2,3-bisphosphoglycerate-independent phosphoglycerate mutase [Archaeoglobus sp.]MBO8179069.1 2,3-bisphosphoglycerate-independent phosphoglycerate mutase [Archaeoglobus sp.]
MAVLLVVVDGLSDRPVNGKTPLSEARKPNLDFLAERGINGIMDTIAPGIRPGSDTSHLALLGYDPYKYYSGRGPIEAAGVGIEVKPGDVAFRANFATVEGEGSIFDKTVVDRRAGRIEDTSALIEAIKEKVKLPVEFLIERGTGHRAAVVFRGEGLSDKVSDTDPKAVGKKVKRCVPLEEDEKAKRMAEMVNEFMQQVHEVLENHPLNKERAEKGLLKANALLLRGAGEMPHVPRFEEKTGLKLCVIAATALIKGVGKIVGADVITPEGATGNKNTNLDSKVETAVKALESYDIVLLHIKATDELGHDGDFEGKKAFIEKLDAKIAPLLDLDFSKHCLILTADHSTPIKVKDHTADPVPVVIVHEDVRRDEVRTFSEFEAYKGGLCRIRGVDLLNIALDLLNIAKKFGA